MTEKKISELTEKEILRQQLELLAEESKDATPTELFYLSKALCEVYGKLNSFGVAAFSAYFLFMGANFVICFMIQIKKLFRGNV